MAGEIYITISDTRDTGGGGSGNGGGGPYPTPNSDGWSRETDFDASIKRGMNLTEQEKTNAYVNHELIHFLRSECMMMINNQIGTMGDRTGNYIGQKNTQVAFGLGMKGAGIVAAGVKGFSVGGPYGALIGASLATILVGSNIVTGNDNYTRQIRHMNQDIKELRKRAGLDSIIDGSRGTLE